METHTAADKESVYNSDKKLYKMAQQFFTATTAISKLRKRKKCFSFSPSFPQIDRKVRKYKNICVQLYIFYSLTTFQHCGVNFFLNLQEKSRKNYHRKTSCREIVCEYLM